MMLPAPLSIILTTAAQKENRYQHTIGVAFTRMARGYVPDIRYPSFERPDQPNHNSVDEKVDAGQRRLIGWTERSAMLNSQC